MLIAQRVTPKPNNDGVDVFGDSISAGTGTQHPYHELLMKTSGKEFLNYAIGSTGYVATTEDTVNAGNGGSGVAPVSKQSGNNTVLDQMKGISADEACIIAAGTNDYGSNVSQNDFRNAVRETLDYALTKFDKSKILVIAPIKRKGFDNANSQGLKLADYDKIIEDEATKSGITCVDGYQVPLDPVVNKEDYCDDGLHLNDAGHKVLADYLEAYVKGL